MIIKVKPQAKKAKVEEENDEEPSRVGITNDDDCHKSSEPAPSNGEANQSQEVAKTALVSYSDESDDDS